MDYFYHGVLRLDWGLGNPNKTAALIAMLMAVVWAGRYLRRYGFCVALLLWLSCGIGLIQTFSRGGIVAILGGAIPILCYSKRPWPFSRILGVSLVAAIFAAYSIYIGFWERCENGVKGDRSIINRIQIWKAAPQMMMDAPMGWGLGRSGEAYGEWYQPLDCYERYRTLVNSHLTCLVELAWPLRYLYILLWVIAFLLCWPDPRCRHLSLCLAVWITFGLAATFSSIEENFILWVIPILCFLVALRERFRLRIWHPSKAWMTASVIPLLVLAIPFLICAGEKKTTIYADKYGVKLGKGEVKIRIVIDKRVMGNCYGHAIRRILLEHPKITYAIEIVRPEELNKAPDGLTVVLAGDALDIRKHHDNLLGARQLILLNPTFFPDEICADKEFHGSMVVFLGEFCQSSAARAWLSYEHCKRVEGAGDFLPQWPDLVLCEMHSMN